MASLYTLAALPGGTVQATRDAAIVHVGRSAGDLAERRRFEIAFLRSGAGEFTVPPGGAVRLSEKEL